MKSMVNKVQLIGRLGKDPQIISYSDDRKAARFAIATSELYKNKAGVRIKRTEWHQVVARGNLASLVEKFLTCGQEVFIEGRLINRSWKDKNGQVRFAHEISLDEFYLTRRRAS